MQKVGQQVKKYHYTFYILGAVSPDLPSHQSKFKVDDRVVVHTVKGDPVTGTVRWMGPIEKDGCNLSVIGIETVSIHT